MNKIASNLQIDSARLWDTIHETAQFGATAKGGVRRLTLGPEDKQVRDWFRTACEAAGLEVHVDALGSMFGLRKGRDMSKPPVGLGCAAIAGVRNGNCTRAGQARFESAILTWYKMDSESASGPSD